MTQRQLDILRFISTETKAKGWAPSVREIGDAFGITSTNGVADHLRALIRDGYLRREYNTARALKLTGLGRTTLGLKPDPTGPLVDVVAGLAKLRSGDVAGADACLSEAIIKMGGAA